MNLRFLSKGANPFSHLDKETAVVAAPLFRGQWTTVELQPDLFAPQSFSVGVVVQSPNDRLHYHLLSELKKFECLYEGDFPESLVTEMMRHAEEVLRSAVRHRLPLEKIDFFSENLRLSKRQYTSGGSPEDIISRLYNDLIILEPRQRQKKIKLFETLHTDAVRDLVNAKLKLIAQHDYEKIVLDAQDGILVSDGKIRHHLDINLRTKQACGSVVSAVYKTAQSIEMNLLRANVDLNTYSKIKGIADKGVFLMLPEQSKLDASEWRRIEHVVGEHRWKLKQDGFRVVSLDSAEALALEIYEWAKPTM